MADHHPHPDQPGPQHPSLDDHADHAEGLLAPERQAGVDAHLPGCPTCRRTAASLTHVGVVLAAQPAPTMPAPVAARLTEVLHREARQRADHTAARPGATPLHAVGRAGAPAHRRTLTPQRHPTLGQFGRDLHTPPAWRRVAPLLVAAVLALVVGFGGYVLSATAGLNEPPVVATVVSTGDLAAQAGSLVASQDLDPHRFSNAWFCARAVTRGRITGLAGARVDGSPALLVYTRRGPADDVTVVTGCNGVQPTAVASATLPR